MADTPEYPEKTCELSSLVTHRKLVRAVLEDRKTQQRRNGVYGYPGEVFELEGTTFRVTALERQTLGDMTEADAVAEGFPGLDAYKDLIMRMHRGMDWDPAMPVWMHAFERVQ